MMTGSRHSTWQALRRDLGDRPRLRLALMACAAAGWLCWAALLLVDRGTAVAAPHESLLLQSTTIDQRTSIAVVNHRSVEVGDALRAGNDVCRVVGIQNGRAFFRRPDGTTFHLSVGSPEDGELNSSRSSLDTLVNSPQPLRQ
jgi:hypothetical protein